MKLLAHPFSSYCQKVLTALYENHTPFEYQVLRFRRSGQSAGVRGTLAAAAHAGAGR